MIAWLSATCLWYSNGSYMESLFYTCSVLTDYSSFSIAWIWLLFIRPVAPAGLYPISKKVSLDVRALSSYSSILSALFSDFSCSTMATFPAISFSFVFSSLSARSYYWTSMAPPFLFRFKISFRYCTSFCSLETKASSAALTALAWTLTMICLALSANFSVEMVSLM